MEEGEPRGRKVEKLRQESPARAEAPPRPRRGLQILAFLLLAACASAWRWSHPGCLASVEASRTAELLERRPAADRQVAELRKQIAGLKRQLQEAWQQQELVDPLSPFGKGAQLRGKVPADSPADSPTTVGCHITKQRLPLSSDAKDWSLERKRAPTFAELYKAVHNVEWTKDGNLYKTFANPYHKKASFDYPHSSIWLEGDKVMATVVAELAKMDRKIKFIVEAGSMHGMSAIRMAMELDKRNLGSVPILCIDPWTGDLNMWLNRIVWDMLDPRDGRATTFDQFVLNVANAIDTGRIRDKHIVPFAVTSIVGARWLQATGYTPNLIYLDSAHEIDETYYELNLYWALLEPGGILMGDDLGWPAVRTDVTRFAQENSLELKMFGVYYNWYIIKPP